MLRADVVKLLYRGTDGIRPQYQTEIAIPICCVSGADTPDRRTAKRRTKDLHESWKGGTATWNRGREAPTDYISSSRTRRGCRSSHQLQER